MKHSAKLLASGLIGISAFASDTNTTSDPKAVQEEQLFQRYLKEMREMQTKAPTNFDSSFLTNLDTPSFRKLFLQSIVDPSFGLRWDEVPAPTLTGSNAMGAVNEFVATNGWNMETNDCFFDICSPDKSKSIGGLPWVVIQEKEFSAVTHDGVLYILFGGFHHDGHGVAYNPQTNHFASSIDGFKPIGQHWYVWGFDHENPELKLPQIYEGVK